MAKSNVSLGGRDILDLESLSVEEIELVLKTAEEMIEREASPGAELRKIQLVSQKGALTAR